MDMTTEFERAFYAADATYDGRFVAAVRTTGIYLPALVPRPQAAAEERHLPRRCGRAARAAGYRACLRCHPDQAMAVTIRTIDTPIGPMTIGATDDAVVLADFTERAMMPAQLAAVRRRFGPTVEGDSRLLDRTRAQLLEYFAGSRRAFDLPLDLPGSAFQERVWTELSRIPYGDTITYRDLAERVDAGPPGERSGEPTGRTGSR